MQTEFFSRICRRAAHRCIKKKRVLSITTTHGARERETRQRQPRFLAPAAIQFSPSSWMSRRTMDGCRATPRKVRALRSFHSCQAIEAKRESKPFRLSFRSCRRRCNHQSESDMPACGVMSWKPTFCKISHQICPE